jgi:hypothetical protein
MLLRGGIGGDRPHLMEDGAFSALLRNQSEDGVTKCRLQTASSQ